MTTLLTRRGKTSLHQLRKIWRAEEAARDAEVYARDQAEELARVKAEDAEIARRRASYPLH